MLAVSRICSIGIIILFERATSTSVPFFIPTPSVLGSSSCRCRFRDLSYEKSCLCRQQPRDVNPVEIEYLICYKSVARREGHVDVVIMITSRLWERFSPH